MTTTLKRLDGPLTAVRVNVPANPEGEDTVMNQQSTEATANKEALTQRRVKWGMVWDPGRQGLIEGIVIDPVELNRLANWACTWDLFHHHETEPEGLREELNQVGGSCDRCRNDAGFMLSECPFLEMNRSPEMNLEDNRP